MAWKIKFPNDKHKKRVQTKAAAATPATPATTTNTRKEMKNYFHDKKEFQCALKCTINGIRSRKQNKSQDIRRKKKIGSPKIRKKKMKRREEEKTPRSPKLSLSMRRHNKTYVYHLFQYCDCYYGDEGTDWYDKSSMFI